MASYYTTIANAVKGILGTVSGMPSTIEVRDNDQVMPRETDPIALVTMANENEIGGALGSGIGTDIGSVLKTYEIVVTIYHRQLSDPSTLGTNPDVVLASKQALNRPTLAGASTVYDTTLVENSAWENREFSKGIQVSQFGLLFYSSEPRAG